jgi:hypothetical protein
MYDGSMTIPLQSYFSPISVSFKILQINDLFVFPGEYIFVRFVSSEESSKLEMEYKYF